MKCFLAKLCPPRKWVADSGKTTIVPFPAFLVPDPESPNLAPAVPKEEIRTILTAIRDLPSSPK